MQVFKKTIISSVVILFSCYMICVVSLEPAKCKGKDIKISENDLKVFKDCVKEVGGSDSVKDIPKEKMPCVGKCVLMRRGLIDENGMPAKDHIISMINTTIPSEVIPELSEGVEHCVDEYGKVDPKEENCLSYQPLCECVIKAFIVICMDDNADEKAA